MLKRAVLFALTTALLMPPFAFAENLTFQVRSFHKNQVDIAFYSDSRKGFRWPGDARAWIIKDYDVHNYSLNCINGEKVCYGAWVRNSNSTYWGTGEDGAHRCESCCFVCNGGTTPVLNLNAR